MQPENQTGEEVMTEYMFKRYEKYRAKSKKYKAKFETAQRENASLKNIIGCLVSSSERQPGKEFNILQLPVLNGFVVVVGNTVRVFDENADHVKVSTEE